MTEPSHGLVFVDELPAGADHTNQKKQVQRAEALRATPGKWAKWPSKTSAVGVLKALSKFGDGFEVCIRERQVYARFAGKLVVDVPGGPPARVRQAQCAYCKMILGEAVDPEELIEIHRTNKPACDRRYKRDGL